MFALVNAYASYAMWWLRWKAAHICIWTRSLVFCLVKRHRLSDIGCWRVRLLSKQLGEGKKRRGWMQNVRLGYELEQLGWPGSAKRGIKWGGHASCTSSMKTGRSSRVAFP